MRKIVLFGALILVLFGIIIRFGPPKFAALFNLEANYNNDFQKSGFFDPVRSLLRILGAKECYEHKHSLAYVLDDLFFGKTNGILTGQTSNGVELKKLIIESFKSQDFKNGNQYWTQIGITSHHLPTALPFISDFYKNLLNSDGPRNIFIILGPDHFERCSAPVSTTKKSYLTPFGELMADEKIINQFLAAGVKIDDKCLAGEHSISVQTIFIKYLFPNAKIVPLTFSSASEDNIINNIVDVLVENRDKISVIGSVDFSHNQPYKKAIQLDNTSWQMIMNLSSHSFNLEYVDSPPSVKLIILLAKRLGLNTGVLLEKANSYDFIGQSENTTGYLNVIFTN